MTGSLPEKEKDLFHKLDYKIMKCAFDIHNRMGRFHDEKTYQNGLIHLLQQTGIKANAEVPVTIEFQSFSKTYFLDLLIEDRHIYELKAQAELTEQCRSQLINYQFITGRTFGKIINFGAQSVQHEFVTSTLAQTDRRQLSITKDDWINDCTSAQALYTLSLDLFTEWGSRLDPFLYTEAIMQLLPETYDERIDVLSDGRLIGSKRTNLTSPKVAIKITTAKQIRPLQIQLQKFLNHTNLDTIQWINLNRNHITYKTLKKNHPVPK